MHRCTCELFHPSLCINKISLVISIFSIICLSISYVMPVVKILYSTVYVCDRSMTVTKYFIHPKSKVLQVINDIGRNHLVSLEMAGVNFSHFTNMCGILHCLRHNTFANSGCCTFHTTCLLPFLLLLSHCLYLYVPWWLLLPLLHLKIFSLSLFFHSSVPFILSSPSLLS